MFFLVISSCSDSDSVLVKALFNIAIWAKSLFNSSSSSACLASKNRFWFSSLECLSVNWKKIITLLVFFRYHFLLDFSLHSLQFSFYLLINFLLSSDVNTKRSTLMLVLLRKVYCPSFALSLNFFAISLRGFFYWQRFFAFLAELLEGSILLALFLLFRRSIALLISFFVQSFFLFPHSSNLSIDLVSFSVFPLFAHFLQLCRFRSWWRRFFLTFIHYIVGFSKVFWSASIVHLALWYIFFKVLPLPSSFRQTTLRLVWVSIPLRL